MYGQQKRNQTYEGRQHRVIVSERDSVDSRASLFTTKAVTNELLRKRLEGRREKSETETGSQLRLHISNQLAIEQHP